MIHFDKSESSVVITCDECKDVWAACYPNLNLAARASLVHEHDVHQVPHGHTQGYGIIYSATRRGRKVTEVWGTL